MNTITRDALIAHLRECFEAQPWVRAAWLGGSDASGRVDAYSDIDLQLIVEADAIERAFEVLHASCERLAPIEVSHRLPEPTWHGFSQEFLRLERCDPNHVIDFLVMPVSAPPASRLLEPERHGTPRVLFDRDGLLRVPGLDHGAHGAKLRKRLHDLRATFELHSPLITRSAARGLPVETVAFYQRFALQPLVELLRMRHDPDRFDFGLRYLDRDLPSADYEFVQQVAFPRDAADCVSLLELVRERIRHELAGLDRDA